MILHEFSTHVWTAALVNHLWQSTAIALLAWLVTLALRDNAARVRYAIWLFASVKFLIPFSWLSSLGAHWAHPSVKNHTGLALYIMVEEFSRPLRQAQISVPRPEPITPATHALPLAFEIVLAVWLFGCIVLLARWISGWRRAFQMVENAALLTAGREFSALQRSSRKAGIRSQIPLLLSACETEPGIFGVIHPVLLWPKGLSERLDDAQIEAIMAHEVEHVRRRDNLTAAIHFFVEALFWFHPLVRWMSAKMNEERERACDEKVLEQNARPGAYAESILKVCAFCMEPPTPCVSGVSGADLKERVMRIMTERSGLALSPRRKLILAFAAGLVVMVPVSFGVLHGQEPPSPMASGAQAFEPAPNLPKYEVATVKPTSESEDRRMMMMTPDGTSLRGVPLDMVLRQAFGVEDDRIIGAPGWTKSDRWDIEAKVAPEDAPKLDKIKGEQRRQMLLPVLVERFNLKYHVEQRELPTYALVIAKGGPKLTESKPDDVGPHEFPGPGSGLGSRGTDPIGKRGMFTLGPGRIDAHGGGTEFLTHALSSMVGRTVLDKTGLTGKYDFTLQWTPDPGMMPMRGPSHDGGPGQGDSTQDQGGPSLFTALEEQLGLKLQSQKDKVDVIVIDHIDLPSAN